MTEEERAVIEYRLARAREALEEAEVLFDAGHVNAYVSRMYYACFYAVSALLLTKDVSTSKHSQVRALLHREFVKPGTISPEMGGHFDRLFDSRQKGDYIDFVQFRVEDVTGWLEQTRSFVVHIEALAKQRMGGPGDIGAT